MLNLRPLLILLASLLCTFSAFPQWTQTSGPEGGSTTEIIQVDNTLLMLGSEGVFRSTDNGGSWALSNSGLPSFDRVTSMAMSGSNVYVSIYQKGVYRSIDKGNTWFAANSSIESTTFSILFAEGANIYAGTDSFNLVYHSPDYGNSWSLRSNGVSNNHISDFASFNSKMYVGTAVGLFENEANSSTWTAIDIPGLSPNGIRSMTAHDGVFYVASDGQMFTSTDMESWSLTNLASGSITNMVSYGGTVYASNPRWYYYTTDNGANWISVKTIDTEHFLNKILVSNGKIIVTSSGGNFESFDNGASWTFNIDGIRGQRIGEFAASDAELFAGSKGNGIFRSSDSGGSWTEINSGLDAPNSHTINGIVALDNYVVIATSGGIYKSNDNGGNWVRKLDPGTNKSTGTLDYSNGVFATSVAGTGIYLSTDMGETWATAPTAGLNTQTNYLSILIQDQKIVVGSASGELFASSDLGQSWAVITIPGGYYNYNDIEYIDGTLYVATHRDLWTSSDFGQNWSPFLTSNSNTDQDIKKVILGEDIVYAATTSGIQVSNSGRDSWYPVNEGIWPAYTTGILIKNGLLFAGPSSLSVWSRPLTEIEVPSLDDDNDGIANADDLCPNTASGIVVNSNGCDLIASDAIRVYGASPTCPNINNGTIELATPLTGYSFNIQIVGEGRNENFSAINLDESFKVDDLASGTYEITVSIPDILYEQIFGVTINEVNGISGKFQSIDTETKSARYIVSGSTEYAVNINGVEKNYKFDSTNDREIVFHNLKILNEILISGKSDCLGKVQETFALEEKIQIYPTITSGLLNMSGGIGDVEIQVYNSSGQLVLREKKNTGVDNSIHLDNCTTGLYIVHIQSEGHTKTFKIIKR